MARTWGETLARKITEQSNMPNLQLQSGGLVLAGGTATVGATITLTANSVIQVQMVIPGAGAKGVHYKVDNVVLGGPGVASFDVTAVDAAAGDNIVATDDSVLSFIIVN